jgi:sec-independent protein translocase protein TatA
MFGLGIPELIVIFIIALVVFGPKKLPDLGKSIGRAMAEFKKAQQEFQESVQSEMREVEKTANLDELKKIGSLDDLTTANKNDAGKPGEVQGAEQKTDPKPDPEQKKDGEAKGNG